MIQSIKKFVIVAFVGLFIGGPLFLSTESKASDGGAGYILVVKEYVLDLAGRVIANVIYEQMIKAISEKIATGGKNGKPTWVEHWGFFVRDNQDDGREGASRAIIGEAIFHPDRATICSNLGQTLADMFGASPTDNQGVLDTYMNSVLRVDAEQSFAQQASCPLPKELEIDGQNITLDDLVDEYRNDFAVGGWNLFDQFTQTGGNIFSVTELAARQQQVQEAHNEKVANLEVLANGGFQGIRPEGGSGRVLTPGSILKEAAAATITKELDWIISSDELDEVIVTAATVVANKLADYATNYGSEPDPAAQPLDESTCRQLCDGLAKSQCSSAEDITLNCRNASNGAGQTCDVIDPDSSGCEAAVRSVCRSQHNCPS